MNRKLQRSGLATATLDQKHICGVCEQSFNSEDEYNSHVCPNTNFQPTQVEHQDALTGGRFSAISEAALERGAKREGEDEHPASKNG